MTRLRAAALAGLAVLGLAACSESVTGQASPASTGASTSTSASASASDSPATPSEGAGEGSGSSEGTTTCEWLPSRSPNAIDVGTPPEEVPATGTTELVMTLGQGELQVTLDQEGAPCASASMVHLAEEGFFDGSPCHREVNQPTFGVLQCGDPTGTGSGGPSYRFAEEVSSSTTYPAGTVAMANSGSPASTGSQFFICFVDTELPPAYTAVGTVDAAGLAVLEQIAAAGNDGSFEPSPGGGAPNVPVTILSATVTG
ncbi:peptidylprolyl isomerase [Blastococcus sp. SYSU D00820]